VRRVATTCDGCERRLLPRGEIYFEVSIRVRPAGELRDDLTPPAGLPGAAVRAAAPDPIGAQLEELELDAFLAQALKTHRFVLCGTCRREWAADPLGRARRAAAVHAPR
jgi:hypothetical protein